MTAEVELRPVSRTLVGPPDQVRTVLVNAIRRGRLVTASAIRRVGPDTVRVELVIMEPATARPVQRPAKPRSVPTRYKVAAGAVTAALGALAAIGALIAAAVQWVMVHAAQVIGAAVLLALVALALAGLASRSGRCMGLHCPGCGHR